MMKEFIIEVGLNGNLDKDYILREMIKAAKYFKETKDRYCIYIFENDDGEIIKTLQIPCHQICKVEEYDNS